MKIYVLIFIRPFCCSFCILPTSRNDRATKIRNKTSSVTNRRPNWYISNLKKKKEKKTRSNILQFFFPLIGCFCLLVWHQRTSLNRDRETGERESERATASRTALSQSLSAAPCRPHPPHRTKESLLRENPSRFTQLTAALD